MLRIVRMTLTKLSYENYRRALPIPCRGIHDRKGACSRTEGGSRLHKMLGTRQDKQSSFLLTIRCELTQLSWICYQRNIVRVPMAGNWDARAHTAVLFQLLDDIGPHGTAKCELRCVPKNIQAFLSTRQCNFE